MKRLVIATLGVAALVGCGPIPLIGLTFGQSPAGTWSPAPGATASVPASGTATPAASPSAK